MGKISFYSYLVRKGIIKTKNLVCVRTKGYGDDGVLQLEYLVNGKESIKKIKPFALAGEYLKEIHGIEVRYLNFNNPHYDRIGCSCINIYNMTREEYNKMPESEFIEEKQYFKKEKYGCVEFRIMNSLEQNMSYERAMKELS